MKIFIPFTFSEDEVWDDLHDYHGSTLLSDAKLALVAYDGWLRHGFQPCLIQKRSKEGFRFTGSLRNLHNYYRLDYFNLLQTYRDIARYFDPITVASPDIINFGCTHLPTGEVKDTGCISWMDGNAWCICFFTATLQWLETAIETLEDWDKNESREMLAYDPIITLRLPYHRHSMANFAILGMERLVTHYARCGIARINDLRRWNPSLKTV